MNSASDKCTNYYKLLGIDAKADRQTVKQAYLAKIKSDNACRTKLTY